MIIETKVTFKLRKPWGKFKTLLPKGRYDDSLQEFPEEIYEEIENVKSGSRYTLEVVSDAPTNFTTLASEEDVVDTDEDSGSSSKRKKKRVRIKK